MKKFVLILNLFALTLSINAHNQLNLLLVMESNDEVSSTDWLLQRMYVRGITSIFNSVGRCDVKIALLNYGDIARVEWGFQQLDISADINKIQSGIMAAEKIGSDTPSMVVILEAAEQMFLNDRPNAVVIIRSSSSKKLDENDDGTVDDNDGDSGNKDESIQVGASGLKEAAKALRDKAEVVVISITDKVDKDEINTIVDDSSRIFEENDYSRLSELLLSFVKQGDSDEEC